MKLTELMRSTFQPLYAVLDSARDPKILTLLLEGKDEFRSLFEGPQGAKLAHIAPYLVRLGPESVAIETLIHEGWGQGWGVYITCPCELDDVRRHLRHFLQVRLPDRRKAYFRFYDPRILRVFLPTCTAEETSRFFGPIRHYLTEAGRPNELLQFSQDGSGVRRITVSSADIP